MLPDGSVTVLGGEDPEPAGLDLRGVFVGSEGMFGVATEGVRAADAEPPRRRHDADGVRLGGRRRSTRERHHRRRHRAGRRRDDGPAVPAGGRGVAARRPADRRGGRTAHRMRRPARAGRRRGRADPDVWQRRVAWRTSASLPTTTSAPMLWKARKGAFGADRQRQAELLPARHRRAPGPPRRGDREGLRDHRSVTGST